MNQETYNHLCAEDQARIAAELNHVQRIRKAVVNARERQQSGPDYERQMRDLQEGAADLNADDMAMVVDQMRMLSTEAGRNKKTALPDVDNPYFGHMCLHHDGKDRDIFLGYRAFIDARSRVAVVDWRHAPVAQIFFIYKEGEEYEEEVFDRILSGQVSMRHAVSFEKGALVAIYGPEKTFTLHEGKWQVAAVGASPIVYGGHGKAIHDQLLGTGQTQSKSPVVSALLDSTQYQVLQRDDKRPLLIVGGAGCGKTTAALHRLAALAFGNPSFYRQNNLLVIAPESGLAVLSGLILKDLGLPQVKVLTFQDWIRGQARRRFPELPRKACANTPWNVVCFKRHPAFSHAIDHAVEKITEEVAAMFATCFGAGSDDVLLTGTGDNLLQKIQNSRSWVKDQVRVGAIKMTEKAMQGHFSNIVRRVTTVENRRMLLFGKQDILMRAVEKSDGRLRIDHIAAMITHTQAQLGDQHAWDNFDAGGMQTADGKTLDESTPDAIIDTIDQEDYAILFRLLILLTGSLEDPKRRYQHYAHLVIDEAQDLAPVELSVVGSSLLKGGSLTVAGDEGQQIAEGIAFTSWQDTMSHLGARLTAPVRLKTIYRSPKPVADFAYGVLGPIAPENPPQAVKEGVPVRLSEFDTEGRALMVLGEALEDLQIHEPGASIAIITRTAIMAKRIAETLSKVVVLRHVEGGEFRFKPGIDVTCVANVKGLEFDYVVIPDANAATYNESHAMRRMLFVASTRAIHQLWLLSVGQPAPLIVKALNRDDSSLL